MEESTITGTDDEQAGSRSFRAIYRLEEMVSALKNIERELNIFLATRQG